MAVKDGTMEKDCWVTPSCDIKAGHFNSISQLKMETIVLPSATMLL